MDIPLPLYKKICERENIKFIECETFDTLSLADISSRSITIIYQREKPHFITAILKEYYVTPQIEIFNCNPKEFPLPEKFREWGQISADCVEPSFEEYENYWESILFSLDENDVNQKFLENEKNCEKWSLFFAFYVIKTEEEKESYIKAFSRFIKSSPLHILHAFLHSLSLSMEEE